MIIKIAGLSEGVHYYKFDEPVESLDLGSPFFGNLTADIELNKTHSEIILNVNVKVNANFECDRCTKDFVQELNPEYQVVYLYGSTPENLTDTNVIYIHPDSDKINIASEMRDYTLLAAPMKKLCIEECRGLCRNCGKDLNEGDCGCENENTDSRWLPLMELKKKLNNN